MINLNLHDDKALLELKKLKPLLAYADKVYKSYISNKKKFVYAKVLYNVNCQIKILLEENFHTLPEQSQNDTFEVLFHLDVWCTIWANEVGERDPSWKSEFVFPTEVSFPHLQASRLLNVIEKTLEN